MKQFPWDIKISPASNGVIVKVGCVKLLYTVDAYELLANDLPLYLKDHDAAIKTIEERWGLRLMEGQSNPTTNPVAREERSVGEDTVSERSPAPPGAVEEATEGQELTREQEEHLVDVAQEEKRARPRARETS